MPGGMGGVIKLYFDKYRKLGKMPPELEGKVDYEISGTLDQPDIYSKDRSYTVMTAVP